LALIDDDEEMMMKMMMSINDFWHYALTTYNKLITTIQNGFIVYYLWDNFKKKNV
jgi:hypothetical protein